LGLVFGHFQTNQLSVGFLSETEPIKFILKSQEPVAALAIPHTVDRVAIALVAATERCAAPSTRHHRRKLH